MTIPRIWQATLLLVGTIVGVGMFGIPFVFAKAGFITGLVELIALAAAATLVHLAYGEVVLRTPRVHRLPGYVRIYLGKCAGLASKVSYLFGLSGTLLAYIALGGFFAGKLLQSIAPGINIGFGAVVFYILGVAIIFRGLRFESLVNSVLSMGLVAAVILLAAMLLPYASLFSGDNFQLSALAIPYGVIIFAMSGSAIIPEMRRILKPSEASVMGKIVIAGTLASAALYLLFAVAVVGATGAGTTPDAITGLAYKFGPFYSILGSMIGFLAAITSFITLGLVLKGTLASDFGFKPSAALLLTAVIPAIFYVLGFQDFIAIIGLVGAVAIGFDSILILLAHRRAVAKSVREPEYGLSIPGAIRTLLCLIFILGIAHEFYAFF